MGLSGTSRVTKILKPDSDLLTNPGQMFVLLAIDRLKHELRLEMERVLIFWAQAEPRAYKWWARASLLLLFLDEKTKFYYTIELVQVLG